MDNSISYIEPFEDQLEGMELVELDIEVPGPIDPIEDDPDKNKTKRLSITLPSGSYQRLKDSVDNGQYPSIAEAARRAIERDQYLDDVVNKGCDLLYQDSNGGIHRLFPNA